MIDMFARLEWTRRLRLPEGVQVTIPLRGGFRLQIVGESTYSLSWVGPVTVYLDPWGRWSFQPQWTGQLSRLIDVSWETWVAGGL